MGRRQVAVAFALAAAGVGAYVFAVTALCGVMEVPASEPGAPQGDAVCVSAVHPLAVPLVIAGAVGAWAAWAGRRGTAAGVAAAVLVVGVLFGLSLGLYGVLAGVLLLASALVMEPGSRRRDAARRRLESG